MRRRFGIPIGLGLLALAFGVAYTTPGDDTINAPFAVRGTVDEQLVSAHLVMTAHDAYLARAIEIDFEPGTTAGIWLVIEATIEGRVADNSVGADLFIDGIRYPATTRLDTLEGTAVDASLPDTGPFLFEVPADILDRPGARSAVVRVGPGFDVRLDSVIELALDLTTLDVQDRAVLEPVRDGTR